MTPSPSTIHATTATARPIGIAHSADRAGAPVRSDTARRQRATRNITISASRTTTTAFQLAPSNQNTLEPRTLRTAIGPSSHDWFGAGKALSTTALNPSTMNTSSGTLRTNSTYTRVALRRMKFWDSRPTPIRVPRTVASTMPVIAKRSVLKNPSTIASCVRWAWRKSLDGIGNPAGWSSHDVKSRDWPRDSVLST